MTYKYNRGESFLDNCIIIFITFFIILISQFISIKYFPEYYLSKTSTPINKAKGYIKENYSLKKVKVTCDNPVDDKYVRCSVSGITECGDKKTIQLKCALNDIYCIPLE